MGIRKAMNKIRRLASDKDTLRFLRYTLWHPGTYHLDKPYGKIPLYLSGAKQSGNIQHKDLSLKTVSLPCQGQKPQPALNILEQDIWQIRLAGQQISVDIHEPGWYRQFDDPEDVAAFHRFLWLSQIVSENITEENKHAFFAIIKEWIGSWIDHIGSKDSKDVHFEVWQTYTVAERISNWAMMLAISSAEPLSDEKIIRSIICQMDFIWDHLEYYGERFTGNHLGNDGRGLYIAGTLLGLSYYADIGKKILLHEYARVVVDGFFLREGSVHYQFLYTKWFADVYWVARSCGDYKFAEKIGSRLEKLSVGCRYFLFRNQSCGWDMPYIGDISPDCQPRWLAGVPWAVQYLLHGNTFDAFPKGRGYHTLFLGDGGDAVRCGGNVQLDALPPAHDWGHIRNGEWEVFAHVNNSLYPNNLTGHFHHDSGSFVLHYGGVPLLIDCGRTDYSLEHTARWQRDYTGHNLMVADALNPEMDMRSFYTDGFLSYYAGKAPKIKCMGNRLKMEVYGGRRIRGIQKASRKIELGHGKAVVEDAINGIGKHTVTALYHVPGQFHIRIRDGEAELSGQGHRFRIAFSILPDKLEVQDGHCADEYGKDSLCSTIVYRKKVMAPFGLRAEIKHIGD